MAPRTETIAWTAKEIVTDVGGTPHLLLRIETRGPPLSPRDAPPFVRLVPEKGGEPVAAWFTEERPGGRGLAGYFPVDAPARGRVEIGWGADVVGRAAEPLEEGKVARLDRKRLPPGTVPFTRARLAGG